MGRMMPKKPPKRPRKLDDILAERRANGVTPNNTDWFEPAPPPPPANGGKRAGSKRPAHFYADPNAGRPITAMQRRFVDEWFIDYDVVQAMIRAGFSKVTAQNNGHMILRHPKVAAEIERIRSKMDQKKVAAAQEVLEEWSRIMRFRIGHLLNDDGVPKLIGDLNDDTQANVVSFDVRTEFDEEGVEKGRLFNIKLVNKVDALKALSQYHKLIGADSVTTVNVVLTDAQRVEQLQALLGGVRARLPEKTVDAVPVVKEGEQ